MSDIQTSDVPKLANGDSTNFWLRLRDGQLVFQCCTQCGQIQHPPGHICRVCWSDQLAEAASSGKGRIESFTVVRRAPLAQFREDVPYSIISVRMDEGPRVIATLLGNETNAAAIGDSVALEIRPDRDGNPLPCFRLS